MFDIRWIRDNPDAFDAGLRRRGATPLSTQILDLDKRRRALQTRLQEIQTRRNAASKEIGALKSKGGDAAALMEEVNRLKDEMPKAEAEERDLSGQLDAQLATIPNIPAADVPDGGDENANVELRKVGAPRQFNFQPLDHVAIADYSIDTLDESVDRSSQVGGGMTVHTAHGIVSEQHQDVNAMTQRRRHVVVRLDMDADQIRARLGERLDVEVRVVEHQVHVEKQRAVFPKCPDGLRTK